MIIFSIIYFFPCFFISSRLRIFLSYHDIHFPLIVSSVWLSSISLTCTPPVNMPFPFYLLTFSVMSFFVLLSFCSSLLLVLYRYISHRLRRRPGTFIKLFTESFFLIFFICFLYLCLESLSFCYYLMFYFIFSYYPCISCIYLYLLRCKRLYFIFLMSPLFINY